MTPEEIRDLYVETLARASFEHFCRVATWEEIDEADRQTWMPHAERAVDALAAAGLLPTSVEGRYIGRGTLRRTRLVTDWKESEQ